ncbi:hypothetical protein, partial [Bacillus sp. UNC41MFS5]|uniref:hypothetical protein n=1 Tax=Bacillus sp. UNC41MFS5 TaxID=1449046 RepID=UPI00068A0516
MDRDIMKNFIGRVIKIDRGGPESKIGMLMDASDEFLAILTEDDGLVYYNTNHIKSFTDNLKEKMQFDLDVPQDFPFIKADNFHELLGLMKYKWIKINRGGPETLEGVLMKLDNESIYLVNGQEIVRSSMFHIKSISYGLKIEKANEENTDYQQSQEKDGDSKNNNKNNNSSSKSNKSSSKSN